MNKEQEKHMQELTEQDYTNVYGGAYSQAVIVIHSETILPELPLPPDGDAIKI